MDSTPRRDSSDPGAPSDRAPSTEPTLPSALLLAASALADSVPEPTPSPPAARPASLSRGWPTAAPAGGSPPSGDRPPAAGDLASAAGERWPATASLAPAAGDRSRLGGERSAAPPSVWSSARTSFGAPPPGSGRAVPSAPATRRDLPLEPRTSWFLEVVEGKSCRRYPIEEGQTLTFGTSSRMGVQLDDMSVSALHGEVAVREGRLLVRDAGSSNGIFLSGGRVTTAVFERGGSFLVGGSLIAVVPGRCDEDDDASDEPPLDGVIGQSVPMRRLARAVRRLAALRAPVLIRGETGTGKELVAHALHRLGSRARGPFVPLNMGSISPDLADGELFGHEKGAFTGAVATRLGAFESARGGTLFLDEVAELPPLAQSKLLRALENGEVRPLGSSQPRQVDVRVVAASWASLDERMAQGAFREDLFHRLAVLTVQVPPLRERPLDIAPLARHFLASQASEVGVKTLTSGAISRLSSHGWPGNVRELRNVMLRAAVITVEPSISTEHIDQALAPFQSPPQPSLDQRRREAQRALEQHRGNHSSAARALGVARSTFRDWVSPREGDRKKR